MQGRPSTDGEQTHTLVLEMIREIFFLGKQSARAKSVSSRKLLNVANLRDFMDTEGLGVLVTKRAFVSILSCFELLFSSKWNWFRFLLS